MEDQSVVGWAVCLYGGWLVCPIYLDHVMSQVASLLRSCSTRSTGDTGCSLGIYSTYITYNYCYRYCYTVLRVRGWWVCETLMILRGILVIGGLRTRCMVFRYAVSSEFSMRVFRRKLRYYLQ